MSEHSRSEWSECSWNPVRGCTRISAGCDNCYARRFAERFRGVSGHPYERGFDLRLVPESLDLPKHWKRPRHVFVNSMSDLFHADIPVDYLQRIFGVMRDCPRHTFRFLTKRSTRLVELAPILKWSSNIWAGVTVENDAYVYRIDDLRKVDAARRFLSLEPLLSPLPALNLEGIHWVVVGGETGPGAREMKEDWVRDIRDQCVAANIPFFFKQWGGIHPKRRGRLVDGRTWDAVPGS